jgi:hypothetical protein
MKYLSRRLAGRSLVASLVLCVATDQWAAARTDHDVTITVPTSGTQLTYVDKYSGDTNGTTSGASSITVAKRNDTIQWNVALPSSNKTYVAAIFFTRSSPFGDGQGKPILMDTWSDTDGHSQRLTADLTPGIYPYKVIVRVDGKTSYLDDPVIIFGGHLLNAAIVSARCSLEDAVKDLSSKDPMKAKLEMIIDELKSLETDPREKCR